MRTPAVIVGATVPALLVAALGYSHPHVLTPENAQWWRDLHIIGLLLFPLLALPPWLVVRGRGKLIEGTVLTLGIVYAIFYNALDGIAGIGGGHLTLTVGPGPWVANLFGIADQVVLPGVYAHLAAAAIAAIVVTVTASGIVGRLVGVVGGVLVIGAAYSYITSHIYHPVGTTSMLALAAGWLLLALVATGVVGPGGNDDQTGARPAHARG